MQKAAMENSLIHPDFWTGLELSLENVSSCLLSLLKAMAKQGKVKRLDEETIQCMSEWIFDRQLALEKEYRYTYRELSEYV